MGRGLRHLDFANHLQMAEERKIDLLQSVLRAGGFKMTRQRRVVYEMLVESKEHLDANDLFERVRKRHPGISLATIYRTVALLKRVGLVKALPLGQSHQHFEPVSGSMHCHLVCKKCEKVTELPLDEVSKLVAFLSRSGWEIETVEFCITGRCPECGSF
jgi:Fe2+ or Zn2+ uptake regulation protein